MKKNVFVMALDDFNRRELQTIHKAENYNFHSLLDVDDILHVENYPIREMLDKAERQLREFEGSVEAIIGHWDFPVSTMIPLLCREFGLRGPSLESILKCEHKYWSRVEQRKVVPDSTPRFDKVDPFDEDALKKLELDYPFWVKPVKSFGSQLGRKIHNAEEFYEHMEHVREHIGKIGDPFNIILDYAELPPEVAGVGGNHCIAEEIIGGRELAPEGYAFNGKVKAHGVVDMVREGESFSRVEYPSRLPESVQRRTIEATEKVMSHIGFDNGCFNVEYFWDKDSDKLWIVEINPRISQSHANVFEKVDGASNHEVAVDVALGQKPRIEHGGGRFKRAAKWWVRREKKDAVVTRVPTTDEIRRIREEVPGDPVIYSEVKEGMRLSELDDQDDYTYCYADIHIGGQSEEELLENYDRCMEALPFEFSEVEEPSAS